jgi:hypothetical protein
MYGRCLETLQAARYLELLIGRKAPIHGALAPYILPVRYKQFKRAEEVLEALPEQAQAAVRAVVAQVGIDASETAQKQALQTEIARRKMAYKTVYLEAIQLEIIRQQVLAEMKQEEEAVFVMITALLST